MKNLQVYNVKTGVVLPPPGFATVPNMTDHPREEPTRPDLTTDVPVVRECAWCSTPIRLRPRARHRRYCSQGCRQRAYEVRTAASRHQADQAAGRARADEEPVREIVERVTVRTPRSHRPPAPPPEVREVQVVADPTKARQISDFLDAAAKAITDGTIPAHDLRRIHTSTHRLLKALDQASPGGLNTLKRR